jgi:hypothetical protein
MPFKSNADRRHRIPRQRHRVTIRHFIASTAYNHQART